MSKRILGLDPGLSATGYALVVNEKCLDHGTIPSNSKQILGERISIILAKLKKKIREYAPDVCAIETLFFRQVSARSVILSAQLRGAILYLLFLEKIPAVEITPAKAKKILTGNGRASKQQIDFMVRRIYNLSGKINEHASDAIAIAYSYSVLNKMKSFNKLVSR